MAAIRLSHSLAIYKTKKIPKRPASKARSVFSSLLGLRGSVAERKRRKSAVTRKYEGNTADCLWARRETALGHRWQQGSKSNNWFFFSFRSANRRKWKVDEPLLGCRGWEACGENHWKEIVYVDDWRNVLNNWNVRNRLLEIFFTGVGNTNNNECPQFIFACLYQIQNFTKEYT